MAVEKFETKKSLGQHFLTSDVVPRWMCDAAGIALGEIVVEIGPGTGVLTHELLNRGARVIALEADLRALEVLKTKFANEVTTGHLTLHHTDVRHFTPQHISELSAGNYKVVANIPYYLSGLLFRTFLECAIQPNTLVYLVQKEVAKRITVNTSRGEKASLLSLSVQVFGTPQYVRTVSRGHFAPPPNVDSAIIVVRNISLKNFEQTDKSIFFNILHLGFGQKRKQLLSNLSKQYDRETLIHIFSTLGLPTTVRAEDVPLEMWLALVNSIVTHKL